MEIVSILQDALLSKSYGCGWFGSKWAYFFRGRTKVQTAVSWSYVWLLLGRKMLAKSVVRSWDFNKKGISWEKELSGKVCLTWKKLNKTKRVFGDADHRLTEGLGLKGPCSTPNFNHLLWAGLLPTRLGCPGFHPIPVCWCCDCYSRLLRSIGGGKGKKTCVCELELLRWTNYPWLRVLWIWLFRNCKLA